MFRYHDGGDHGAPAFMRSDNGPEFVPKAILKWIVAEGIGSARSSTFCGRTDGNHCASTLHVFPADAVDLSSARAYPLPPPHAWLPVLSEAADEGAEARGVVEDGPPLLECEIGRDDDRASFVSG